LRFCTFVGRCVSEVDSQRAVRVAIVEDDAATRKLLVESLKAEHGYDVVAEFSNAQTAISALPQIAPDLVLVDLGLPDHSGINVIRNITAKILQCDVLVLTTFGDERTVMEALEAGADGYLLKGCTAEELRRDIHALRHGGSPLSPAVARQLLSRLRSNKSGDAPLVERDALITKREVTILEMIARGHSYNETAEACEISPLTVHSHLKSIYRKLQVHSKTEAIYVARNRGLIR
jgi:DNA-binding NarL/FixJ family response regulator